ncbi:MAG TPA: SAM-dependent methyltransferase [Thermoanaerobaculia bacterium]|nr:SAM-dependent methyltransferase [Thermoanaerobaculia bacterium]
MDLVPFSQCALWHRQKEFFRAEGVEAWNGKVPFYITSNPYLAHSYATLILRCLQDLRTRHGEGPVIVLELGAGTGAFSYQVLRCLAELMESCPMLAADLCYVMSDVAERNLEFWRTHPALAPFVERGLLDFALFDLAGTEPLRLDSGRSLSPSRPLVVIANYVFDSLPHDLYRATPGEVEEVLVPATLELPASDSVNGLTRLVPLPAGAREEAIRSPRYGFAAVDEVLWQRGGAMEGLFLFPGAALECLGRLRESVSPEVLVLVADKGAADTAQTAETDRLTVGRHGGSLSTLLDFGALEAFALRYDGDAFLRATEGIVIAAYSLGLRLRDLPEARLALVQFFGAFNPGHIYDVLNYFEETKPRARLETLVALLELTLWDPFVFDRFFDVILATLPYASGYALQKLMDNLPRIADSFFYLPAAADTFSQIGILLQERRRYEEALAAYGRSLEWHQGREDTFYNMGLCCYALGRTDDAVSWFQEVLRLAPGYIKARGWIAQIEHERLA